MSSIIELFNRNLINNVGHDQHQNPILELPHLPEIENFVKDLENQGKVKVVSDTIQIVLDNRKLTRDEKERLVEFDQRNTITRK